MAAVRARRATIFLEDAPILEQRAFAGDQYVLRVHAPKAAAAATPGSFAHIGCDPDVPLRRPLSIMRADRDEQWLEFLYRPIGHGLRALAARGPGETLSVLAPIGRGFEPDHRRPRVLAIGGGVGIPPMIFAAQMLRDDPLFLPFVLMGSEVPFPFDTLAAGLDVGVVAAEATDAAALLESWGVPSRLASQGGLPGCYRGFVPDLARRWLTANAARELDRTQIIACGPEPMLEATAKLAAEFNLPCQIAVEEYMACGVGGCAGCTVRAHTAAGTAMKRVCVDGPVFDAREIYPT
jgi:dihydroorotate dehydrogenase electron transfer subunit